MSLSTVGHILSNWTSATFSHSKIDWKKRSCLAWERSYSCQQQQCQLLVLAVWLPVANCDWFPVSTCIFSTHLSCSAGTNINISNKLVLIRHYMRSEHTGTNIFSSMSKKIYQCPHCQFKANQPSWLKVHVKGVHDKIRDHACEQCDFRTA